MRQTVEQAPFDALERCPSHRRRTARAGFQAGPQPTVFDAQPGDARIGEVAEGPVIVARSGVRKTAVFGFHPALSAMRYELAAPLLFANLLRWVSPEVFRRWEIAGGSVGTVKAELDQDVAGREVKVTSSDGSPLPFTLRGRALHFYAGTPGLVRVAAGDREYLYSLTLPEFGDTRWQPPPEARQGIPRFRMAGEASSDLWPWLALAGGLCLVAEWLLYGRTRRTARRFLAPLVPLRIGLAFRRRTRQPLGVRR